MTDFRLPDSALDDLSKRVAGQPATGAPRFGWADAPLPARIGQYAIKAHLGRGGMSVVYRAADPAGGPDVAVKVLADSAAGGELRERLAREGAAIARLDHPNIVRVKEVGSDAGRPFLVMELIEGEGLEEAMSAAELPARAALLEKVARAVAHAHQHGIAHRDLKPGNIRVSADRSPHVMDFGLAGVEGDLTRLTRTGTVMGTPAYMAPEQVRGEDSGVAADAWALGVLLYQALTGGVPFEGASAPLVYQRVLDADPAWPRRRAAGVPAALEAVCLRALDKDRMKRPSAAEFADELRRWLDGAPVRSRLPSPGARLVRRIRRNPLAWAACTAAFLAAATGSTLLFFESARHQRAQRARDLVREAQPLAAQAVLAELAGDHDGGVRLMKEFDLRLREAVAMDASLDEGWFERAEYLRICGDDGGAGMMLVLGRERGRDSPAARLTEGLLAAASYRRNMRLAAAAAEREKREAEERGGPRSIRLVNASDLERADPGLAELRLTAERNLDAGVAGLGGADPPSARLARAEFAALRGDVAQAEALLKGLEWAEAKLLRGTIAESANDLAGAESEYSRAIATRESLWEAWEARASVRERRAAREWRAGTEAGESVQEAAISDWTRLVEARGKWRRELYLARAAANVSLARMRLYRQADVKPACERAMLDASAGGGRERSEWLGKALSMLAGTAKSRSEDPERFYALAVNSLREAVADRPKNLSLLLDLASTLRMRAFHLWTAGEDANDAYREAQAAFDDALALSPGLWHAHANKGILFAEQERWKEAIAELEKAAASFGSDEPVREQLEEARKRASK